MQPKLKTSRGGIRLPMSIGGVDRLHTAPLPETAALYLDCPAGKDSGAGRYTRAILYADIRCLPRR